MDRFILSITNNTYRNYDDELSLRLDDTNEVPSAKIYFRKEFANLLSTIMLERNFYIDKIKIERDCESISHNEVFLALISKTQIKHFSLEIGFDPSVETDKSIKLAQEYEEDIADIGCVERWINILNSISKIEIIKIIFFYDVKIVHNAIQAFLYFLEKSNFSDITLEVTFEKKKDIEKYLDISENWEMKYDDDYCEIILKK